MIGFIQKTLSIDLAVTLSSEAISIVNTESDADVSLLQKLRLAVTNDVCVSLMRHSACQLCHHVREHDFDDTYSIKHSRTWTKMFGR